MCLITSFTYRQVKSKDEYIKNMAASLEHQRHEDQVDEAMDHGPNMDREIVITKDPDRTILTRAAMAVFLMSPAHELEHTLVRTKELLEYALLTHAEWLPHPLKADLHVDLSSIEGRAR